MEHGPAAIQCLLDKKTMAMLVCGLDSRQARILLMRLQQTSNWLAGDA